MYRKIMLLLLINLPILMQAQFSENIDLNSDGTNDLIKADIVEGTYSYRLQINNDTIISRFSDGDLETLKIIDINKWDKFKEIALHTSGPSNDDEYMIYWYDGNQIIFMNHLSRWPEFKGNGIIYLNNWEGFWSSRDKYVLDNKTRKLKPVEQFAYYVGFEHEIGKGFKIYKEKELINEVALLADSSKVELILCDKTGRDFFDYRFLIKTSSGLLGWSDYKTIEKSAYIPMAD